MRTWIQVLFAGLLVTMPVQGKRRGAPEGFGEPRSVVDGGGEFEPQGEAERAAVERAARSLYDSSRRILNVVRRSRDDDRYRRGERNMIQVLTDFNQATYALSRHSRDARRGDLREAVRKVLEVGSEISRLMDGADPEVRNTWRDVDSDLARLADHVGERYSGHSGRDYSRDRDDSRDRDNREVGGIGRMRWRGRVDGSDCITLRGDRVTIRHLAANTVREEFHDVSSPLPRRPVEVRLNVVRGRGRVFLSQRPAGSNGYTAEVCIEDDKGGDDFYEFELVW